MPTGSRRRPDGRATIARGELQSRFGASGRPRVTAAPPQPDPADGPSSGGRISRRSTPERLEQARRLATLARLISAGMLPDRAAAGARCLGGKNGPKRRDDRRGRLGDRLSRDRAPEVLRRCRSSLEGCPSRGSGPVRPTAHQLEHVVEEGSPADHAEVLVFRKRFSTGWNKLIVARVKVGGCGDVARPRGCRRIEAPMDPHRELRAFQNGILIFLWRQPNARRPVSASTVTRSCWYTPARLSSVRGLHDAARRCKERGEVAGRGWDEAPRSELPGEIGSAR